MTDISERLRAIRSRIEAAEAKFGRRPGSVSLLAVSKTKSAEAVVCAHRAGQNAFGENHLQEAAAKIEALGGLDLEWHFIGPVQSNKTRSIAGLFDWVHSVDRLKVASRLGEQRTDRQTPLDVCIQVNISNEPTKSGVETDDVEEMAREISKIPRLRLRGLMAIPRPETDFEAARKPFRSLRLLLESLNDRGHSLDTLSMGMTDDMEAAIAEGATMVRIGTAIFGARD